MKLAIAGDSAGEGLAKILAEHLKDRHEVSEVSRTDAGPDAFYANLSDRVASGVLDGTYDKAILVCGTGIGVVVRIGSAASTLSPPVVAFPPSVVVVRGAPPHATIRAEAVSRRRWRGVRPCEVGMRSETVAENGSGLRCRRALR